MQYSWIFVLCYLFVAASSQDCNNLAVQDLELVELNSTLIASWNAGAEADDCELEFTVTYSSNVASQDTVTYVTSQTSLIFENIVPCSDVTVEVAITGGTSESASVTIEMRETTAPVLREMITSCNSIQMIWDAQPFVENMCQVTHFQMFCLSDTHNFTVPQAVSDIEDRTFDVLISGLQPDIYYTCNGFIFVTLAGFSPPSENIEFWSNLDSVRELEVTETEDSLRATWKAPLNSEECGVAYDVTFENEVLGSETVEVVGLSHDFDIELIPCTNYTITVTPISFTGSKGTPVSKEITPSVRVGQVTNLTLLDSGDDIVVSWSATQVGKCDVSYVVQHLLDGILSTIETQNTSAIFERITCTNNEFFVNALSEGITGNTTSGILILDYYDITSISEVRNVRLEGNLVAWDAPLTVGLCNISYIVEHENIFMTAISGTSETSINLNLIPCSNNTITISGVANSIVGESSATEIIAPSQELSAPTHLRTVPNINSANITLQGQNITENLCQVEVVVLECSNNNNNDSFGRYIQVTDDYSRLFTVVLTDLEYDTIYSCVARLQNSSSGDEFIFRTVQLTTKELNVSYITQDSFLVSWTEDYGKQFVNGYTLIVESTGPLHNVSDNCDIERSAIYQYELDASELSSLFAEGFPNYLYRVSLITSYTLGFDVSSAILFTQTLTGVPGVPVDLNAQWISEMDHVFNVSALLSWSSPCDLNGDLQSFGVNVTANFVFGGELQSVKIAGQLDAVEDVNSIFNHLITDINPFFTYDISVNTIAAAYGPSVELSIQPPTTCACEIDVK